MSKFQITRKLEIDAAHRVPEHGSGCKHLHGHRYVIEATCEGELACEGEQRGMVLDFKFIKEEMVKHIHDYCDHGCILRFDDSLLETLAPDVAKEARDAMTGAGRVSAVWSSQEHCNRGLKLYILDCVPTAENLARHWYELLKAPMRDRSDGRAKLVRVRVYETPNCWAEFPSQSV